MAPSAVKRIFVFAIAAALASCGETPQSSSVVPGTAQTVFRAGRPPITTAAIERGIVGRAVEVQGLRGGPAERWTFEPDDFREIRILDFQKSSEGEIIDVLLETDNNRRAGEVDVHVAGTLRLHYEWTDGEWHLGDIENVSLRYSFKSAG